MTSHADDRRYGVAAIYSKRAVSPQVGIIHSVGFYRVTRHGGRSLPLSLHVGLYTVFLFHTPNSLPTQKNQNIMIAHVSAVHYLTRQ
jgi:hypothetical protein